MPYGRNIKSSVTASLTPCYKHGVFYVTVLIKAENRFGGIDKSAGLSYNIS